MSEDEIERDNANQEIINRGVDRGWKRFWQSRGIDALSGLSRSWSMTYESLGQDACQLPILIKNLFAGQCSVDQLFRL